MMDLYAVCLYQKDVFMSATKVNVNNFVRAETNRMFAGVLAQSSMGEFTHWRQPTALDNQTIIRMNRDTLYSSAIVDISQGAEFVMPDTGDRYGSVMIINQDHYINHIFHAPGTYSLTMDEYETRFVFIGVRLLVDPNDPDDIAIVNSLQDQMEVRSTSNEPFVLPEYDQASLDETRDAILTLARGLSNYSGAFGSKENVDPITHLLGTAYGWGGLPETEAMYLNVDPRLPVGEYTMTVHDVPVDAFWSISLYNERGFFEINDRNMNSVNSITADRNDDGSITVNFGNSDEDKPNYLPIMEGWNYVVRLYRPHSEILDGSWTFPSIEPV